jgi:hypothetical protein
MSISNHFGRVKTSFVPYKSKHVYDNGMPKTNFGLGRGMSGFPVGTQGQTDGFFLRHAKIFYGRSENESELAFCSNVSEEFAVCVSDIEKFLSEPNWAANHTCPVMTFKHMLTLKVDDVDRRVDHLEKLLQQVMEDNLTLQNKVVALEHHNRVKKAQSDKFFESIANPEITP